MHSIWRIATSTTSQREGSGAGSLGRSSVALAMETTTCDGLMRAVVARRPRRQPCGIRGTLRILETYKNCTLLLLLLAKIDVVAKIDSVLLLLQQRHLLARLLLLRRPVWPSRCKITAWFSWHAGHASRPSLLPVLHAAAGKG